MSESLRWGRFVAVLLLLLPSVAPAANPCANGGSPAPIIQRGPGDEGGVGGTGVDDGRTAGGDREGGIGGTGVDADAIAKGDDEGGIGGTGIEAETAIIGTVTGFASICVGGTEVHYDADTPVHLDGAEAAPAELAVGQVVQVVAAGSGERVKALSIDVDHVIVGPITAIDPDVDRVEVMGQAVLLTESAGKAPEIGQWVRVSGLRRADEVIVATRIDLAGEVDARVSGLLQATGAGHARIGSVSVRLATDVAIDSPATAVAVGRWSGSELVAERVETDRIATLRHRVQRVQVEGYVESGPAREIEVGGWKVEVPEGERAAWTSAPPESRVQIKARVDRDGCLVPDGFKFTDSRRPPDRPPDPQFNGQGPNADNNGPPPQGMSTHQGPGPGGPQRFGKPSGADGGGRPPRPARPPRFGLPQRPDLPRAQRPPPPPRGPQPPRPPKPPRM